MTDNTLEQLRTDAQAIFQASLQAVDPYEAVRRFLHLDGDTLCLGPADCPAATAELAAFDRILVVGGGKATAPMARAAEDILGDRIAIGVIVIKVGFSETLDTIETVEAGHPVPDADGVRGTGRILELLNGAGEKDLVISLISGGGSALLPQPVPGIELAEKQALTKKLLACGAAIDEINAIRKHISASKGGQMARAAFPATVFNLMLSDVVGDKMDVIASGPFVPDGASFADVADILEKYRIRDDIPEAVRRHLDAGLKGDAPETPKEGDPIFERVHNVIVGSNMLALEAAADKARALGYSELILSSMVEGETREIALAHTAMAKEILKTGKPLAAPACVISGGETTVTIRGDGLGGRNQEFALAAALDLAGLPGRVAMLCGATDGNDGPTDAAGGLVDPGSVARGAAHDLSARAYLDRNDAYHYLEATGDLLKTGPTRTNVMDVRLILVR